MALGCAFIFVVFMWLWRRHARKKRAKRTAAFARRLDQKEVWRRRFARFAELFSKKRKDSTRGGVDKSKIGGPEELGALEQQRGWVKETEYERLMRLRDEEAERHAMEMKKLESGYVKSLAEGRISRQPSIRSSVSKARSKHSRTPSPTNINITLLNPNSNLNAKSNPNRTSAPSLYSQLTGMPRSGPEPKQPVRDFDVDLERGLDHDNLHRDGRLLTSRFSVTTTATSLYNRDRDPDPEDLPPMPILMTDAEVYAARHKPTIESSAQLHQAQVQPQYATPTLMPIPMTNAMMNPAMSSANPITQQTIQGSGNGLGVGGLGSYWLVPRESVPALIDLSSGQGQVQTQNTGSSTSSGSQLGSRNPFRR